MSGRPDISSRKPDIMSGRPDISSRKPDTISRRPDTSSGLCVFHIILAVRVAIRWWAARCGDRGRGSWRGGRSPAALLVLSANDEDGGAGGQWMGIGMIDVVGNEGGIIWWARAHLIRCSERKTLAWGGELICYLTYFRVPSTILCQKISNPPNTIGSSQNRLTLFEEVFVKREDNILHLKDDFTWCTVYQHDRSS
jgi:hypothetical protein